MDRKTELFRFYSGKYAFVTGYTGFKWTWRCRILINAGAKVTGYSLESPTNPNFFTISSTEKSMVSVNGDI